MNWHICHKKKLLFCSYFLHISLCFYSNFDWESLLNENFDSASNEYPHSILLIDFATPKTRNTWNNVMMTSSSCFSIISYFWGSRVQQKYEMWVLVGCGIKLHIQRALPIEIWVKTQGDMSKIQTKKVVFFMIPIPKFILKKCLRPIWYFKFKEISLDNIWWHGIWIKVKRPILSWNFL